MDILLEFIPEEERVKYTALTGQSLFYMGETELVHKTLAISEDEGAEEAVYALKIMQSEKELCIASTGKDAKSGRLVTHVYKVKGPAQTMMSTTAAEIDEELQNRCLILAVSEERAQTQKIHEQQRENETLAGLMLKQKREKIWQLHKNAQRLLRPLHVVNPYAKSLTFLDTRLRTRRDHKKYLTLICAIALLRQYQRKIEYLDGNGPKTPYIKVTISDIEIANRLAHHLMGTSLDELAPQTRRLLGLLCQMVDAYCEKNGVDRSKYHFTRRDVREYTGWGDTQLKVHMNRLTELEYLLVLHGGYGRRFVYELVYRGEGRDGKHFLMGLIDVDKLKDQEN